MDVDLALLADAATIDGAGKLNILGIFDRLHTPNFPARHPKMALVLRFSAPLTETGRHDIEITLKDPAGIELIRLDGEMYLAPGPGATGGSIRVPHVLNMDGLVFPNPGTYAFDVRVDGVHHVSLPLAVYGPETTAEA
ncbi:MAG TPA: hypothetical protein EYO20_06795 [Gemmatimonadetes bacterium]|jgi:hypothetical protein|nr:hypothetical protein [Gemmatimonadota bacterium]HIB09532.1 hypothetical protein [Gemmatimonadota bacterium]HIN78581.1 hypothetical protein [Gemmatimonadota bacterium]